jgi:hypothetical protein
MKVEVLLTTVFWSFIPSTLTAFIQKILYSTKLLKPWNPQTQKRQYIIIFSLVIMTYFTVSVIKTWYELEPNFYSVLNVQTSFNSKDLKVNYRSLSLQYHPDKNGQTSEEMKNIYHEKYLKIRKAYEVLSNKNTLFAYEKFSDGMLDCTNCKTRQDFMYHGLVNVLAYHGFSSFIVFFMNFFSESSSNYWKFYFLFTQIAVELYMLTNSVNSSILNTLTTGEKITLLRNIGVSGYMAITALSSAWSVKQKTVSESASELGNINRMTNAEIVKWYKWIYEPFSSDLLQKEFREAMRQKSLISMLTRTSSMASLDFDQSHGRVKPEILKKND